MAWIIESRVKEVSSTAGTSNLTLSGAVTGFRAFSSVCSVNDTFPYVIEDPITGAWEEGIGTYSSTNTLTRTTVQRSSNSNAAVSFAANSKNVYLDITRDAYLNPQLTGATVTGTAVVSANTSVGLGNAALRITQTGSDDALRVEDSANPDSTPFVIDQNGRAAVGYTSVITGTVTPPVQTIGSAASSAGFGAYLFSNVTTGPIFEFGQSDNASLGSHTVVASGDNLGFIRFSGSDGTAFIRASHIGSQVDGTPGTNSMPGRLVFSTTPTGSATPTERMRIDSAGKVLVNGASGSLNGQVISQSLYGFTATRSVADNLPSIFSFYKDRAGAIVQNGDLTGRIDFLGYDGATSYANARIEAYIDAAPGTNDMPGRLVFSTTADGASTTTERMRIDSSGRVGIGMTPSTADKVQVTGDVKITGNLTVTGSASVSGGGGDGGFALKYSFDTGTGGSPASGKIQLDNATPASATLLYINETDAAGISVDTLLDDMVQPDWIMLSNSDRSKFHVFQVAGTFESGASVDPIPVIYMFGTATNFSASETIYFSRSVTSPNDVVGQAFMVRNSRYVMWG